MSIDYIFLTANVAAVALLLPYDFFLPSSVAIDITTLQAHFVFLKIQN